MSSRLARFTALLLALGASSAHAQEGQDAASEHHVAELALARQPGLRNAIEQLESARWSVIGERARYAPSVVVDSSYTRTATPTLFTDVFVNTAQRVDTGAELRKSTLWGTQFALRLAGNWRETKQGRGFGLTPGGKFGPGWGVLGKLSLKQPLLRGRGREVGEAELASARAQRSQAERTRDRVASELLRDVLTAYWELWYADRAVLIEQEALVLSEKQRDEARARAETGSLARADVLTFETQVAQGKETLLTAKGDRMRREHELRRLIGQVDQPAAFAVLEDDGLLPEPMNAAAAERDAEAEALALQEAQAQLELARVEARTAADPLRARLDLDSYVQIEGLGNKDVGDAFTMVGQRKAVSAFVGLTYEAPLNDAQERAAAARARLSVSVAEQTVAQARDQALSDVRVALSRQDDAVARLSLVEETVRIAEQQLAAEQARYSSGSATPLNVTEAEDAVRSARLRVARARADLRQIFLSLEHTTGRLLSRYAAELAPSR